MKTAAHPSVGGVDRQSGLVNPITTTSTATSQHVVAGANSVW